MSWRFLPVFLVFLAGCGKSPDRSAPAARTPAGEAQGQAPAVEAVPGPEQTPGAAPGAAAQGAPASLAKASQADVNAVLGELTQALRKYSFEHQRMPKTFSEVIAAGYVKNLPQPPAGRKFGIDPKTVQVILEKQ